MAAATPEKGRRLGRGLDFLLSTPEATKSAQQADIKLEDLRPNPWQPRAAFDPEALSALTESIRQHGVIQPISVRKRSDGGYELIAGERRMLAARRAGLKTIPAVVHDIGDSQMLLVALVENLQRSDLNPVERARALKRLVEEHGKTHDEVAALSGLGRSTVSNSIRLLELDEASLAAVQSGSITEGHARALLAEPDAGRRSQLLARIVEENLNVRQIELVAYQRPSVERRKGAKSSEDAKRLARLLSERLGTSVRIVERGPRGRIVISYATLKDFERLFELLAGEPPPVE